MELYQLRSFSAVAKVGHLTRAAEVLHLSQPALSAHIKALEEELEVELFERAPSGMVLTPAGERLLAAAEKTLAAAQELRNEARAIRGTVSGSVTVGTLSDPEFLRLGDLAAAVYRRHPLLQLQFQREVSGEAFEHVREGKLDASFYYGERTHLKIARLVLRDVAYRVVAPKAWAARIERCGWSEVETEPWILTPPISTHYQLASELFRRHEISPSKVVQADDENVIASLVAAGMGMALMREDLALEKQRAGLICLWNDLRLPTTLQFIYLKERDHDPVLCALVEILRTIWSVPE